MGKGKSQDADSGIGAQPYEGDMYKNNQIDLTEDNAMSKAQEAANDAKTGSDD